MRTRDEHLGHRAAGVPAGAAAPRIPGREAARLARYHLRLLDWWLFLLMGLAWAGAAGVTWLQVATGLPEGLRNAAGLSRFVLEPGAGLFAALLGSALLVNDPLLEVTLATRTGAGGLLLGRGALSLGMLGVGSAAYLALSLALGVPYAQQQSALYLLLVWLAPVLLMGLLGLGGALLTGNAPLGLALAAVPLAGSLFLYMPLQPIAAAHLFMLSYTFSGGQDAPDWWANRLTLLALALAIGAASLWLLRRDERLLGAAP